MKQVLRETDEQIVVWHITLKKVICVANKMLMLEQQWKQRNLLL